MNRLCAMVLGVCGVVLCASLSRGDVKYVDAASTGANTGVDWVNAYTNLPEALANTGSGTNLWIAQGTYYPSSSTARTDTVTMKSGVHLYGGFTNGMSSLDARDWLEYRTILSGDIGIKGDNSDNSYHILTAVNNGIVDGLTFVEGNANGATDAEKQGSAIYSKTTTGVDVLNCVFMRNRATGANTKAGTIYLSSNLIISNCLFAGDTGAEIINITTGTKVRNSVFVNNSVSDATVFTPAASSGIEVMGCTFFGNSGNQIRKYDRDSMVVRNCLLWGNSGTLYVHGSAKIYTYYSDIEGCGGSGSGWAIGLMLVDMGGNIDADPKFVHGPTGTWTHAASYASGTDLTTLSDTTESFTPNALKGKILNPDDSGRYAYTIVSNTDTQIVVWGDASALGTTGTTYRVVDCHLQSTNGHWTTGGSFVNDTNDSPCLDVADPGYPYSLEPSPNGGCLNMGGYGNSSQASKSIDVQAPAPVSLLAAISGNDQVSLKWKNPSNLDFAGVLVLRRDGSAPTGTPVDETTYTAPNTLGDGDIVYVGTGDNATPGASSGWTDSTAVNGTHYYYLVFAYDGGPRYSAGLGADTTPAVTGGESPIFVDPFATGDHNGTAWANAYTNLQTAISAAVAATEIWVARGTYKPGSLRSETFQPLAVKMYGGFTNGMSSIDERDWFEYPTILSGDIDNDGVLNNDNSLHVFKATANVTLDGFHITGGYPDGTGVDSTGGGVYATASGFRMQNCVLTRNWCVSGDVGTIYTSSGQIISDCVFAANTGGPVVWNSSATTMRNCLFLWNAGTQCIKTKGVTLINSTFTENAGETLRMRYVGSQCFIRNSIFWNNAGTLVHDGRNYNLNVSYSNIEGSGAPDTWTFAEAMLVDLGNNIDTNPLFVAAVTSTWTHAASYSAGTEQTTLTDATASFTSDALRGRHLNPDTSGKHWYYIVSNSDTQIVVNGNASGVGTVGKVYSAFDAHLQSEVGHWTYGNVWSNDTQTSDCIDAGDPADDLGDEPSPNGGRINMGVYGGTDQASKKLSPPPDPVVMLLALAGNTEVKLAWENPFNAGFSGVLILRQAGSEPMGMPVQSTPYTAGGTLGGADIVYVGPASDATPGAASDWTDTGLANGTHYYYKVFAYDSKTQYSSGEGVNSTASALAGMSPIYVDDTATGANNGTSWADAYNDLVTALAQATNGVQVWVAEGTYKPGVRRTDSFTPASGVTVYGGFTNGMMDLDQRDWLEYRSVLSGEIEGDNSFHVVHANASCTLDGLEIRDGYANGISPDNDGSGILVSAANVMLKNCVFTANYAIEFGDGLYSVTAGSGLVVTNCVFAGHSGSHTVYLQGNNALFENSLFLMNAGTVLYMSAFRTGVEVRNCTFARNAGDAVNHYHTGYTTVNNCIIWGNGGRSIVDGIHISYSDIEGSGGSDAWALSGRDMQDDGNNIDEDPLFGFSLTGAWTADATYNAGLDRTTLTDAGAAFSANALRGMWLNPKSTGEYAYYVIANTATQMTVFGDASALGTNGTAYEVLDVHVNSTQGRWTRNGWARNWPHSPCIDAGDTNSVWNAELTPNGKRINMGAYGGTEFASKSSVGATVFILR